ncbi:succinate dehydrogenase, hydrophobic membrane anchor protein [Aureimonas fodinaquatilis]|uniref:Succinate dehydrogenase hydrophobic membrane anchor subunit n=1 Tax=Aureimonas fodinaquatilis TaxID=2565783 RepID=A0A5B0DTG4_9HYPH|nr:succinate dehydrogenase, hydrophobic membrane anchor protein [Aureimonas fodinaquatilis]KAA0969736.1 succinate dehydrogenase, hydrophobic membrane anchor protein [Aureimonas fodinaquatilis]
MSMRTPLGRVRGLGSAKEGTGHFWMQRVTGVANLFLMTFFVFLVIRLSSGTYADVVAAFGNPLVGLVMGLVVVSATVHMRLGMQIVIEDYLHGAARFVAIIANTFFSVVVAFACLFAIIRLSLGA